MHITDNDVLTMFADYQRAGNRAPRTISTRASILRSFAQRQDTTLLDATVFHLRREVGREDIAASTRASTRGTFLAFYSFLHAEGLRPDNPAMRLPVVKVPTAKPRPYSAQQIDALLDSGAYRRTRVMILLGHYQGLRASEIAAVHADDFDLHAGTIKVLGKGGRTDYLPLHDVIRELVPQMGDGYWFPARRGRAGHIRGQSVSDLLHDARERAQIADKALTGHSLRHSFGTELVRRGANIRAVQELMRHASLKTTARYTEVLDEDRREALAVLPGRTVPRHSGRPPAGRHAA
ncbi:MULTISPECIES: tyrosine-type recombinase/integrase [unclassified Microbacterium]|uniref:tyrosine-type recombinase/integrase n=1 Tax=unclassified Microbacterium TaxID=2609290 RepID=UPI003649196D